MAAVESPESLRDFPLALVTQMITLSTSGFGVVVALAWNELIRQTIETYVKPYLGNGSGVISLLIYAVGVTILAVVVTMQLSTVQKNLENLKVKAEEKLANKKPKTHRK